MTNSVGTKRTLFISDEAYYKLIAMGRYSGNIVGKQTAKGISALIERMMQCTMEDARPEDVRSQDAIMLEHGISPDWRLYSPRKRRNICLSDDTVTRAVAHCIKLGIAYPPAKRILQAPTHIDSNACMAALLEAIGTHWVQVTS